MSDYFDPQNEELLRDFFTEAGVQVESLESNILVLENDPQNQDAIDEVFRAAHTLKSAAATVQMTELSEFTHLVEDLLDRIRSGVVGISAELTDTLLQAIDVIKAMIHARSAGIVYEHDISALSSALQSAAEGAFLGSQAPKTPQESGKTVPVSPASGTLSPQGAPAKGVTSIGVKRVSEYELLELRDVAESEGQLFCLRVEFNEDNPMNTVGGIQVYTALRGRADVIKTDPEFDALYQDVFYPVVEYYVATQAGPEQLGAAAAISDVTDSVTVLRIESSGTEDALRGAPAPPRPDTGAVDDEEALEELEVVAQEDEGVSGVEPGGRQTRKLRNAHKKTQAEKRKKVSGSVLRVDSRRIDDLLNLVSETVINKASFNQLSGSFGEMLSALQGFQHQQRETLRRMFEALPEYLQRARQGESTHDLRREFQSTYERLYSLFDPFQYRLKNTVSKYHNSVQSLGRISGELQAGVMRIRMIPIAQIFSRFPRLVRDLSRSLNKNMRLKIEGEDTELDKSVVEDLLDPLIHCVRNALDHGIETPEQRRSSGKPEEATVTLRASNEGNMILIEVSDDGPGIDVASVRSKAIERGLIHPSRALTDSDLFNLLFDPGFSTATTVTSVSGRGVGLDVVKRQIEKLNGDVLVWSKKGVGTTFTIKIPLTLAIIQGLSVRVGKETYVIPMAAVIESHRIKPAEIKTLDNYEVFNVREDVVSLLRLNRLFNVPTEEQKDHVYVVVVGSGDKKMGLIVDSLIGEEDIVIKPLPDHYTNAPGIAGANITGDGTVALIIDVAQLLVLGLRQGIEQRGNVKGRIA